MRINNKRMERFHMRVNSFTYQPYAVEREVFQPERSLRPVLGKRVLTPKSMQLIAEFRSKKDISDFLAELLNHEENMIDIEDGFKYRCYLSKLSQPVDEYWQGWYRVTIPLSVIQEGSRRQLLLSKAENHIVVAGNWQTECVYEITPMAAMDSFTIDGHTIRKLYANRTVYFDGELKKVYTDTEPNKYPDCTLKQNSFPTLDPGSQKISMSSTSVKVVLKYTSIFV